MAEKAHFVIDKGTDFERIIELTDENGDDLVVTGYSARGKIKKHYTSTNSISFNTTLANGSLTLSLSAQTTSNTSISAGRYVYDIELVSPSNTVTRILEGIVTFTPEVTT